MIACSYCNTPIIPGARFCTECGTIQESIKNWNACPKCNTMTPQDAKYCAWCGNILKKDAPVQSNSVNLSLLPVMIYVSGGAFQMGTGQHIHPVKLSPFKMSAYPITQAQYESIIKENPSRLKGQNKPVESVNWCEAIIFCNKLSIKQGLIPCYIIGDDTDLSAIPHNSPIWKRLVFNSGANGYRLPTEAEWEFAARGGTNNDPYIYSGSNSIDEVAWYGENSEISSHDVCSKKANSLGIYDMSGNVCEWVFDEYGEYALIPQINPKGPAMSQGNHVKRGGSWLDDSEMCSVFYRSAGAQIGKSSNLGFRVCTSV